MTLPNPLFRIVSLRAPRWGLNVGVRGNGSDAVVRSLNGALWYLVSTDTIGCGERHDFEIDDLLQLETSASGSVPSHPRRLATTGS